MGAHIIDGEFQSDKYPTTPRGKVPLSVKDESAQDLLWAYAQRRRAVDASFADDLETALRAAGFAPGPSAHNAPKKDRPPAKTVLHSLSDVDRVVLLLGAFKDGGGSLTLADWLRKLFGWDDARVAEAIRVGTEEALIEKADRSKRIDESR